MIERFNFYDVYGYLIPGAIWIGLLAIPFALVGAIRNPGATELTVVGLVGGYVAGHFLSGMARQLFPSRKYRSAEGEEQQLSDLLLNKQYRGKHALVPKVWDLLQKYVDERFGLDISNAGERKGVFFLCRTALAQGKVGSYVEQYQGLLSLTRSLAAACIFAFFFYVGWVLAFCFPSARSGWNRLFSGCLPVVVAVVPIILILIFDKDSRKLLKAEGTERAADEVHRPAKENWEKYLNDNAQSLVFMALLCAIGFVAEGWFPLTEARSYRLAALSSILLIAVPRFFGAAESFDSSLATSVFRDFIVLSTGKGATATTQSGP